MILALIHRLFLSNRVITVAVVIAVELLPLLLGHGSLLVLLSVPLTLLRFLVWSGIALMILRRGVVYTLPIFVVQWLWMIGLSTLVNANASEQGSPSGLLFFSIALVSWLLSVLPAMVLRITRSWQITLLSIILPVVLLLSFWGVKNFSEPLAPIEAWMAQSLVGKEMASIVQGANSGVTDPLKTLAPLFLQVIIIVYFCLSLGLLLLGRYWQSALFVPQGFSQEFLNIRFSLAFAIVGCLGFVLLRNQVYWSLLSTTLVLPLVVAGLSLLHTLVETKKLSKVLLWLFYGILPIILIPFMYFSAVISVVDAVWDIRQQLAKKSAT